MQMLSLGVLFVNGRGYCFRLAAEAITRSFLEHCASLRTHPKPLVGKEQELTSRKLMLVGVTGLGNRLSRGMRLAGRPRFFAKLLPGHQKPESRRRRFDNHLVHKCERDDVMAFWARGESPTAQKACAVDEWMRVREGIDPTKWNDCAAAKRPWHGDPQWLRAALYFRFQLALPRKISPAQLRG